VDHDLQPEPVKGYCPTFLQGVTVNTIIELMEKEIWSLKRIIGDLHKGKLYDREKCRTRELVRFQRILGLLEVEASKELDWREPR
jgi:hypothetical protein